MPLRQHLLIVDDQRVDRAIGTHAATQIGYTVSCAASIDETRALLETGNRFDFVVLDLALGVEDGLEVLPLIARFDPAAVVVLASSFGGRILAASQRLASGLGLRVAGVLRKPILPTALQRLLQLSPRALGHDLSPKIAGVQPLTWQAASSKDTQTTYRLAHSVTGAARNVGADTLAERASTQEQTVGSLSATQITAEIVAMQSELDVILSRLGTSTGPTVREVAG